MGKYYIEAFVDVAGKWRWHLKAANGQILASSEAYSSDRACLDTVYGLASYGWLSVIVKQPEEIEVKEVVA